MEEKQVKKRRAKKVNRAIPKITLNMIVKDEAKIIRRCLNSVKHVIDNFVIVDTGSKDNTIPFIREFSMKTGIPGDIYLGQFKNFSQARNDAFKYCEGSDYVLLMDADMVLSVPKNFKKEDLMADAYYIDQYNGDLKYSNIRLVKYNEDFKYEGVTHEFLDVGYAITENLDTLSIKDFNDGGSKEDKFKRDIKLLEDGLTLDPDNTRYLFYLANSYRDIGNFPKALHFYKRRLDCNGWIEERYMAAVGAIQCLAHLAKPKFEIFGLGYYAQKLLPNRMEAAYEVIKYIRNYGNEEDYELAYEFGIEYMQPEPKNGLFIDESVYRWKYFDELSILAYFNQDSDNYKLLMNRLIEDSAYPKEHHDRITRNLEFVK